MARLGQHFLASDHYLSKIVEAAEVEPDDRILEIGPGTGHLTERLLDHGARVVAIEYDRGLVLGLQQRFEETSTGEFHLIQGDAAAIDWPGFDKLVTNLPYQISSPVVGRLLETDYTLAVLTLQREFAERLVADPGTKAYSRLTVNARLRARTELLFRIPPGAFNPPPQVESACVRMTPRTPPEILDEALLQALLLEAFNHRRKMLRSSLKEEDGVPEVLEAMGVATQRPAKLTPDRWVELANQVARVRGV